MTSFVSCALRGSVQGVNSAGHVCADELGHSCFFVIRGSLFPSFIVWGTEMVGFFSMVRYTHRTYEILQGPFSNLGLLKHRKSIYGPRARNRPQVQPQATQFMSCSFSLSVFHNNGVKVASFYNDVAPSWKKVMWCFIFPHFSRGALFFAGCSANEGLA